METKAETTTELGTTDSSGNKKLFVAGVSWSTTDDGFYNFFARFGEIAEAVVMKERTGRSRGFGFVTFKDPSAYEKVQSQTLTLDGRKLDIMEAIPRQEMLSSSKPLPKKIYVAGVSYSTTDDGFFNFFSRFGNVVSAQIQRDRATTRSRGFGFVTFEDTAAAEKVLSEASLSLDGRRLEIKSAVPKGLVAAFEEQQRINAAKPKKIFVAGLSDSVSDGDLREHFEQYGKVLECYVQKNRTTGESRGFGFVTFENGDSVEKVLLKPSQKIGDKCIADIKVARPKDTAPSTRGAGWNSYGAPPVAAPWGGAWGGSGFNPGSSWGGPGVGVDRRGPPTGFGAFQRRATMPPRHAYHPYGR